MNIPVMRPQDLAPLVQTTRGGHVENLHFGALAHVNAQGDVLHAVGNPHLQSFTRSTLKALQALPFVQAAGLEQLGYTEHETALLCASHNGEAEHVATAQSMLTKAGTTHKALQCGCHVPGIFSYLSKPAPADLQYDERHHNCSGKHSGMLGACRIHGWDASDYLAFDHPLQQAVRRDVAAACSVDEHSMAWGTDGCSAPNYTLPLSALALGYARMAASVNGRDVSVFSASMAKLGNAMRAQPHLVAGTDRNDTAFMQVGQEDLITKVGADGVQVVASVSRGEAFALKVAGADGAANGAAALAAMVQLGWIDDAQRMALAKFEVRDIVSVRGAVVGQRTAVFDLR
jgi:L-asparaginase II